MQATAAVAKVDGCPVSGFRGLVFDLDGTLLDSERRYREAFRTALAQFGFTLSDDLYREIVGISMRDRRAVLERWLGVRFPFDDFKRHYATLKAEILAVGVPARPGAAALISDLFNTGAALAVATSATRKTAFGLLDSNGLTPYFDAVVTRNDVEAGKPAPETHLRAAELLGLPPAACLALEDSKVGLLAARRAGMQTLMVVDTVPASRSLRGVADAVADDIHMVARIVRPALNSARGSGSPARRSGRLSSPSRKLQIVIIGLTISSSWGNGHATTYRSLARGLAGAGHSVVFFEHDKPWYRDHRDLADPAYAQVHYYQSAAALAQTWTSTIRDADLVIVGSYVPDGIEVCDVVQRIARGVTAFYDIDTPVTLRALADNSCPYLSRAAIANFDVYLSFTGGPILRTFERTYGARLALPLYCSVDASLSHAPVKASLPRWDLGYLGTYSPDRQPAVDNLLCRPAQSWTSGRFVVAGPLYPLELAWPDNVERIEHAPPATHAQFYGAQRYTLNVTRADMKTWGYSPSVRLFEAAACGTPIVSDSWPGLATLFRPGEEILLASSTREMLDILRNVSDDRRLAIAARARDRVLANHTGEHRAAELASVASDLLDKRRPVTGPS